MSLAQNGTIDLHLNEMFMNIVKETYLELKQPPPPAARYSNWFTGEGASQVQHAQGSLEQEVVRRVAEKVKGLMLKEGGKCYNGFASKIQKFKHNMQMDVKSSLIKGQLAHGVCRFGQVVQADSRRVDAVQFYVTNGEIDIDPSKGDDYINLLDRSNQTRMFFGIGRSMDRIKQTVTFNEGVGDGGLLFLTKDPTEALAQITAASTGRTIQEIRSMLGRNGPPEPAPLQAAAMAMRR